MNAKLRIAKLKVAVDPRSQKQTLNKTSVAAPRCAGLGRQGTSDDYGFNGLLPPSQLEPIVSILNRLLKM